MVIPGMELNQAGTPGAATITANSKQMKGHPLLSSSHTFARALRPQPQKTPLPVGRAKITFEKKEKTNCTNRYGRR